MKKALKKYSTVRNYTNIRAYTGSTCWLHVFYTNTAYWRKKGIFQDNHFKIGLGLKDIKDTIY